MTALAFRTKLLQVFIACCIGQINSAEGKTDESPCVLSYFDLWWNADIIFTSQIVTIGNVDSTLRLKIDHIVKWSKDLKDKQIKQKSPISLVQELNLLTCDGKFRIGETRVIFARIEREKNSTEVKIRILRAPKVESWLVTLLGNIQSDGKCF
eukprot:Seg1924.1 transcript_id=Seg1924.1/GoldUCD/mRNA.D3Y31 product="hypothetical protein" protein_id=Seg1924.1/GoldUCD/D3Y31